MIMGSVVTFEGLLKSMTVRCICTGNLGQFHVACRPIVIVESHGPYFFSPVLLRMVNLFIIQLHIFIRT